MNDDGTPLSKVTDRILDTINVENILIKMNVVKIVAEVIEFMQDNDVPMKNIEITEISSGKSQFR